MLTLATLYWGLSFPLIKGIVLVQSRVAPESGAAFVTAMTVAPRFLLGGLILALWQWRGLRDISRGEWRQGLVLGLFSAAGIWFQNDGLKYTEASTSAFLTQLYAILIPVWLAVRHWRNPGAVVWLSGLLVLAGVAVLGKFDWRTLSLGRGELETLTCSVFFMGQILELGRPEHWRNRPEKITLVLFLVQGVIFAAMAGASAPSAAAIGRLAITPAWVGIVLVLTLVCTIGAYSLMNAWQPRITATEAGLIYCVEPIFGSVLALVVPGWLSALTGIDYANETATWTLLVGGGLITAANLLIQLGTRSEAK